MEPNLARSDASSPPAALAEALARGDRTRAALVPMLRHLLSDADNVFLHDEILARTRGMLDHLAEQLLQSCLDDADAARPQLSDLERLSAALAEDDALLAHLHSLALEWRFTRQLEARGLAGPVLTPLLQDIVSADDDSAAAAMAFTAAQARFVQSARRLQCDLRELPGDLVHSGLVALERLDGIAGIDRAVRSIRDSYDEAATRLALAETLASRPQLRSAMLDPEGAGFALFASGLARAANRSREQAILGISDEQPVRLGLLLRAADVGAERCRHVLLALHPEIPAPESVFACDRRTAAALLDGDAPA